MMSDHDYNLIALREACDEDMIEEIEVDQAMSKEDKVNWDHTTDKKTKKLKAAKFKMTMPKKTR